MAPSLVVVATGMALGAVLGAVFLRSLWRTAELVTGATAVGVESPARLVIRGVVARFAVASLVIVGLALLSPTLLVGALLGFVLARTIGLQRVLRHDRQREEVIR